MLLVERHKNGRVLGCLMIRPETIGSLVIGIVCLAYGAYCMAHGGTHTRNTTWFTREEAPKTFWSCMGLYLLIGVGSLFNFAYINFLK